MEAVNGSTSVSSWALTAEEEQRLRGTDDTVRWLCNPPTEILRQFAGKWVAARDCAIAASAETYEALITALAGTDLQSVVIHRIEQPAWVLVTPT